MLRPAPFPRTPVTGATDGSQGTRIVRATAVLVRVRTDSPVNIDLSVPIWTIEHIAAAFHVSVHSARECTYRQSRGQAGTAIATLPPGRARTSAAATR